MVFKLIQKIFVRLKEIKQLIRLLGKGVEIESILSVKIRGIINCEENVYIGRNVELEGKCSFLNGAVIESNSIISNSIIGKNSRIKPNTMIKNSEIGENNIVGPYARVRPHTTTGNDSQIGNFVEIKNSMIGNNCKINHLSFIGDSEIHDNVIIGAGTVTCNYDGYKNQKTIIENNAFIGSGVFLIAPVRVGESSTIGSGSIITDNTPKNKLTIARSRQVTIDEWESPRNQPDKLDE